MLLNKVFRKFCFRYAFYYIKKQRKQSTILKVQHIKIYDFYCCPLSVSYIVFYVYRPMSVCKRSEVTLCIMQDVDGRELAL